VTLLPAGATAAAGALAGSAAGGSCEVLWCWVEPQAISAKDAASDAAAGSARVNRRRSRPCIGLVLPTAPGPRINRRGTSVADFVRRDVAEIARMLDACSPGYRTLIATALYTGMRNSELLGLTFFSAEQSG
jgi:integrase